MTTMLERRTQFHQSTLVNHVTSYDPGVASFLDRATHTFVAAGSSYPDAQHKALGLLWKLLGEQAATLDFLDCFRLLGYVALLGVPLALLIKKFRGGGSAAVR
jgi:MFS transporter, DHA2 family, multidrug resistance protein